MTAGNATYPEIGELAGLDDRQLAERVNAIAQTVQQDSAGAAASLTRAAEEAKRRGLSDLQAQCSYLGARAEVNQGRLPAALELIERARTLWLQVGATLPALRTDLGRMHVLDDLGRHADAVEVGDALVARLGEPDCAAADQEQAAWMRAAALENLGVSLGFMGDHARALEAYASAEATYRDMGLDEEVPRPLANRGVELIELGRYADAIEALSEAADGFARHGNDLFVGKCFAHAAQANLLRGDYLAAAAAAQKADRHLAGQPATTEYARAQIVRAQTLTSLNLLDEALDVFDAVLPQLEDAGLRHDVADATYGRGVVLARLGESDRAWSDFSAAAAHYIAMTAPAMAATAMLAQSELAPPEQAETLVDSALEVLETSGRSPQYAAALVRKAQLATPDAASAALDMAAAILADLQAPGVEWRVHREQARLALRRGDVAHAYTELERALTLIDAMRGTVVDERQRMFFMAGRDAVIEDLVRLQLGSGDLVGAYRTTEEARARTLVERQRGELSASHLEIPLELDALYSDLLRAGPSAARSLRSGARLLERSISTRHRESVVAPQPPVPTPTEGDAVVVTYQTLGDEIMAFVQSGGNVSVARNLTTIGAVQDLMSQLDVQWRRFGTPGLAARQHSHLLAVANDVLQQLYLRLIAGLPGLPAGGPLLVVPCEPLGNVPFAAVHDGVGYLVERMTVAAAPSRTAAKHAEARRRRQVSQTLVLGVADPGVPHVLAEAEEVAEAAENGRVLIDEAATVDALRSLLPAHDVVHLACHGVHRPDSPLFSALRLGDRWLTAAEVAGFELDGQLIVLSACSSGRQLRAGTGDELVGLPRAFLAAGAGGVVVNLWQVDDASSRALMTRFHLALRSRDPAAALRAAQNDLMQDLPHPYHWAPAVVFGAPQPKEHE